MTGDHALIPLAAITLGIGFAGYSMYLRHRQKMALYEERRFALEKGLPVSELPVEAIRIRDHRTGLRWGLIFLFFGIGLFLVSVVVDDEGPAVGGILFGMLGLANLVYYIMAGRRNGSDGGTLPPPLPPR